MSKADRKKERKRQKRERKRNRKADEDNAEQTPPALLPQERLSASPNAIDTLDTKQPAQSENNGHSEVPSDLAPVESPMERYARKQTIYTLVLTIATLASVAIAVYQWFAMRHQNTLMIAQNEVMEKQLKVDQRAWLSFEPDKLNKPTAGQPFIGQYHVRNTGKTPAQITNLQAEPFVVDTGSESVNSLVPTVMSMIVKYDMNDEYDLKYPGAVRGGFSVAPATINTYDIINSKIITDEEAAELEKARKMVLLFTFVRYRDVFGESHRSWSLFYFMPDGTPRRGIGFDRME